MSANEKQVGGEHYRTEYQHWDWAIDIRLGYLESAATKYITRWPKKNGVQDVKKGIHYLEKAMEAHNQYRYINRSIVASGDDVTVNYGLKKTRDFVKSNGLSGEEADFMIHVAGWKNSSDLKYCIAVANEILAMAQTLAEAVDGAAGMAAPGRASMGLLDQNTGACGGAGGTTTQPPPSSASKDTHFKQFCDMCDSTGVIFQSVAGKDDVETICPVCDGRGWVPEKVIPDHVSLKTSVNHPAPFGYDGDG